MRKEIRKPPIAEIYVRICRPSYRFKRWAKRFLRLTCIHRRDDTFHNENGQHVKSRQGVDSLTDGRQLRNHVQEHGHQRQKAQPQRRDDAISLANPFRQDKTLGTLPADNRAERSKDQQREGRGESVDDNALNASDGGEFGVREQDTGPEA